MKRFLIIFLGLLLPYGWMLMAQPSFATKKAFDGKVLKRSAVVETLISGKQLAAYRLSSFHSLRYAAGTEEAQVVEDLVLADAAHATEKETVFVDGKLTYAVLAFLEDAPIFNEYICYQSDGTTATLVYMGGKATLDDLKSIFATKE